MSSSSFLLKPELILKLGLACRRPALVPLQSSWKEAAAITLMQKRFWSLPALNGNEGFMVQQALLCALGRGCACTRFHKIVPGVTVIKSTGLLFALGLHWCGWDCNLSRLLQRIRWWKMFFPFLSLLYLLANIAIWLLSCSGMFWSKPPVSVAGLGSEGGLKEWWTAKVRKQINPHKNHL